MPAPTAECMICHQTVTKRSTLSLDFLGLGDGRACRSHPEVQQAQKAKAIQDEDNKRLDQAASSLRVMSAIAAVRVMRSFFNWPISVVLGRIRGGLTIKEMDEVIQQITEHGAQMSADEMLEAVIHAQLLTEQIENRHLKGE